MTRECHERMWNLAYRLAQSGEHRNYQAIEWNYRRLGIPKRANYYTPSESVNAWTAYAPKLRGLRPRLFDSSSRTTWTAPIELDLACKLERPAEE
jgi:hypothetical protein